MTKYIATIWLEIHIRVKSKTKMFCSCKNAVELADEPNKNVCQVCMWFPWTLPALNEEVVRLGLIWWMAMNCEVNKFSRFDRKTYFIQIILQPTKSLRCMNQLFEKVQ